MKRRCLRTLSRSVVITAKSSARAVTLARKRLPAGFDYRGVTARELVPARPGVRRWRVTFT